MFFHVGPLFWGDDNRIFLCKEDFHVDECCHVVDQDHERLHKDQELETDHKDENFGYDHFFELDHDLESLKDFLFFFILAI